MTISLAQALAWRLGRHHLVAGAGSVTDVIDRLVAVPAWAGDAELAVARRLSRPEPGAVAAALANRELIKTYAFGGATHLMTPENAGVHLAVRAAGRQWELPSWQAHYGLAPDDWPALRQAVRDAVADGPVSHDELADRVAAVPRFRQLRPALAHRSHTLLKPLGWLGDLSLGTGPDGSLMFLSPTTSPGWTGPPDLDDAGRRAVLAYLGGYGPATLDNLRRWLVAGLSAGRRRLDGWLVELGDRVTEIDVCGTPMLLAREHVDALVATEPDPARVTLLPGRDQWAFGAGTDDARVVPPVRRQVVTRGAGLVLLAGVVAGTWRIGRAGLAVSWFAEAGDPPGDAVRREAERLAGLVGRDLDTTITVD